MSRRLSKPLVFAATLVLLALLVGTWCSTALGQLTIRSIDGYSPDETSAVERALAYWNDVIDVANLTPDQRNVAFSKDAEMAGGSGRGGWGTYNGVYGGFVTVAEGSWITDPNTQIKTGNTNLESLVVHELGHVLAILSLGITVNDAGTEVTVGTIQPGTWSDFLYAPDGTKLTALSGQTLDIDPENPFTFRGTSAMLVWGDGVPAGIPVIAESRNIGSGSTLVHPVTPFGNMNAYYNQYSRPFFSEVELAIMQDLGHTVNRSRFFGRSIYQDGTTITNDTGFNGNGTYGIGLHIVSGNNSIIQNANLAAGGYAGAGIRIENVDNTVTIAEGVRVEATGEEGVGVLITHGAGTQPHAGIDSPYVGNGATFNNYGTIYARMSDGTLNNAIHITSSGGVATDGLNIYGGSQITGHIVSEPTSTTLNFRGNDDDPDLTRITVEGDISLPAGNVEVETGASLLMLGTHSITASAVQVAAGGGLGGDVDDLGTLSIVGNLAMQNGSTLLVGLGADDESSLITVTGTANIGEISIDLMDILAGNYTLVSAENLSYTGSTGSNTSVLLNGKAITDVTRAVGVTTDVTTQSNALLLEIEGYLSNFNLTWTGEEDNIWNTTSENWSGQDTFFRDHDSVIFDLSEGTKHEIILTRDVLVSKDKDRPTGDWETDERGMRVSGDDDWTFTGGSIGDGFDTDPDFLAALVFDGTGTLTLLNDNPNTYHDGTIISGGGTMIVRGAAWLGSTEFVGEDTGFVDGTPTRKVQSSGYGIEFIKTDENRNGGTIRFQSGTGVLTQRISVGAGSSGTLVATGGTLTITTDSKYQGYAPNKNGGAVNVADDGDFTTIGQFLFSGNVSQGNGGAIYAGAGTTVDLSTTESGITTLIQFTNNKAAAGSGGAIYIEGTAAKPSTLNSQNVLYTGNSATQNGGALYLVQTKTDISGSTFGGTSLTLGNTAVNEGGAVYYSNATGSTLAANSTTFQNNQGLSGGAIYVATQTTVNANQSTFISNATTTLGSSGGAIALAADESTLNVNGTEFRNNVAAQNGGAISAGDDVTINANDSAVFAENRTTAGDGGAIYLSDKATLNVAQATFNRNEARSGDGGAIRVGDASSIDAAGGRFTGNLAGYQWETTSSTTPTPGTEIAHGGAIAMIGANAADHFLDISAARFSNNYATGDGGAVYSANTAEIFANGVTFRDNTADGNGGAMYLLNTDFLDLTDATFGGNNGDAIYFKKDNGVDTTIMLGAENRNSRFERDINGANTRSSIYFDVTDLTTIGIPIDTLAGRTLDIADPFVVDDTNNEVDISITKTGTGTWQLGGVNDLRNTAEATTVDIEEGTFSLNGDAALLLTNANGKDYLEMLAGARLIASGNNRIETTDLFIGTGTTMRLDGNLTLNIGNDYTIGATLSGWGDFIKEDAQKLTFAGQTSAYDGNVSIKGGGFDLIGHFTTTGTFNMDSGTALHVIADANQPAISSRKLFIDEVDLNISGLTLEKYEQEIIMLRTTNGIEGDFNSVTVGGTKEKVDYLSYNLGFMNDRKDYGGLIGLRWYSMNDELFAHGTFTLDEGAAFTVNVPLNNNTENLDPNWNGKSLTKKGPGTLILVAENGYTGTTTIKDGELVLKNALGTGIGPKLVTVNQAGSLVLDFDDTYEKSVDGDGRLIKRGNNTVVDLAGNNTYKGGTIIEGGILGISDMSNIGFGTVLFTGGTLRNNAEIDNFDRSLKAGVGQNVLLDTSFDLTVTTPITASGVGDQAGGLIKTGDGILTLTAQNTYHGDTTIRGGTLKLDAAGSVFGDVRVSKGGAVGGGGTIGGNLFVNNGGALEWFFAPTQAASPALNVGGSVTLFDDAIFRPRTANTAFDFTQPIIGWTVLQYGGTLYGQFTEIDNRFSPFFDFDLDYDPERREIRVSGNLLSNPKTLSDSVTTSLVMANRKVYRQVFNQLSREAGYSIQPRRNTDVRGQSTSTATRSAWFTPTIRANRYASTFHTSDPYWFESYGMQAGSTVWSNHATALGVTFGYERGLLHNHIDQVRSHDYFFGVYHGQVFSDHYEVRSYLGAGFQDFTSFRNDGVHNYVAKYKGGSFEGNIELSRHYVRSGGYFLRPFVGLDFEYAHIETANENEVGYEFRQYPRSSLTQFFARTGVEIERRGAKVDVHGGATLRGLLIGPVRPHGNVFYPTRGAGSEQIGSRIGSSGVTMNVGFNWHLDKRRSTAFFMDYYADIFFDNDGNGAMHTGNLGVTWRF